MLPFSSPYNRSEASNITILKSLSSSLLKSSSQSYWLYQVKKMSSNQYKKRDFGKRGFPSKCICGSGVCTFTSKTQENPGRPFYRCETMRDEHLFKWVEDSMLEEMEDALPKLENIEKEVYNLKSDVESLKEMIQEMKEEVIWTKNQMRKWKICSGMVCLMFLVLAIVYQFY